MTFGQDNCNKANLCYAKILASTQKCCNKQFMTLCPLTSKCLVSVVISRGVNCYCETLKKHMVVCHHNPRVTWILSELN